MAESSQLTRMAREIEEHLTAVRRILRQPVDAEFARGNLTTPQRHVMQALYHTGGVSLKDLSRRVGLAHSTVSGIVDRLEERGLAKRTRDPADGRSSTIVVSKKVCDYMRDRYPSLVVDPVVLALRRAKPAERAAVLEGLRILRRVVEMHRGTPNPGRGRLSGG
ncbi:MAG: MarR family winged helix-turn-helix transcriptional regulator [Bryobacteraceae bacterium]